MKQKVAIHSVPRSGSSWLGSIFDSSPKVIYRYQPLFSYAHKGQLKINSTIEVIGNFFNDLIKTDDDFVLQKNQKEKGVVPSFNKSNPTHIAYKEVRYHYILQNLLEKDSNIILVGLIRNPFAVINSWFKAPKEFKKELGWNIADEWFNAPKKNMRKPEEFNGYNKWKEVCFLFLKLKKKYPDQFYLINYDDLLSNPISEVKQLFDFCDLDYSEQTDTFIKESTSFQSNDPYAVFKQKKDDMGWKKTLPNFIKDEIMADEEFKTLNKEFKWI